ncbi:hypothetical protein DAMA08_047770 [Martiniozyma asiatica (nom. inval.)]|nr:hypothetical protein DAMA08_047770 [Martiniozyma asiatica]
MSSYTLETGELFNSTPKHKLSDSFKRKEISFFSVFNDKIFLDQSQLHPITLPHLKPALNVKIGHKKYIPKTFRSDESTIGNFLNAIALNKDINVNNYQLICPSNFFQCCALLQTSEFDVILYKEKIIIANTNTRVNQNAFISYIGIRFEDIITNPDCSTRHNRNSYNSIVETEICGMKCLYTCEIDSYNPDIFTGDEAEVIDSLSYTEIKMLLANRIPQQNNTNKQILQTLSKVNFTFENFLYKLLVQCRFGNNHNALLGIRDSGFNVRLIRTFELEEIVTYFKSISCPIPDNTIKSLKYAPGGWDGYVRGVDYITGILELIRKGIKDKHTCFKLNINSSQVQLVPIKNDEIKAKIINRVTTSEFCRIF